MARAILRTSRERKARAALAFGLMLLTLAALAAVRFAPPAHAEPKPVAPCAMARVLSLLQRYGAAEAALLQDLKTEPGLRCGTLRLKLLAENERECAQAKALAGAGQKAKAEEAYEKVLEANPESTCAEPELKKLGGKSGTEKIESFGTTVTSVLTALGVVAGALLVAVIAALIVWLLVLQVLTRCRWTRDHRPATWAVRPGLEVKELDSKWMTDDYGPQFAGLVRAGVTPAGGANVNMVTGHTGLSERLKPIEEIAQAKAAAAVVSFLLATLPRRQFEVSGALQPAGEEGIGASIILTNDGRSVDAETLWAKTFEVPDGEPRAIQTLAVPVAAWVVHRTALALGGGKALITANSMSFAFFKAGSYWQGNGQDDKAANLYRAALAIDPRNSGALANLGLVQWRAGERGEAVELFERALDRIERTSP